MPDPRTGRVTSFRTQTDAKQFLVARVIEQATSEGVHLSDAERHMLSWSESDPDFTPDFDLAEAPDESLIRSGDLPQRHVRFFHK